MQTDCYIVMYLMLIKLNHIWKLHAKPLKPERGKRNKSILRSSLKVRSCFRGKKIISSTVFCHEIKITDLRFFEERDE